MKGTVFQDMIDQALLQVHTGFFGKITAVSGNMATVQPLNMIKAVGGQPQKQAVIPNCPVLDNAVKILTMHPEVTVRRVQAGDTVYCVCADRDISETRSGNFATPMPGHHSIAGAVVIGIM